MGFQLSHHWNLKTTVDIPEDELANAIKFTKARTKCPSHQELQPPHADGGTHALLRHLCQLDLAAKTPGPASERVVLWSPSILPRGFTRLAQVAIKLSALVPRLP